MLNATHGLRKNASNPRGLEKVQPFREPFKSYLVRFLPKVDKDLKVA